MVFEFLLAFLHDLVRLSLLIQRVATTLSMWKARV
jgi:hypothetical protein